MAAEVGAIRARMELDARGFNTELLKAKQSMTTSANEARKANNDFKQITRALLDIGMSGKEVRKVQQEFREIRPDVLEQQLKHLEVQLRRVGASDAQIARIKAKMTEVQEETKKSENRIVALREALFAIGGGALLVGLVNTFRSLAKEAQNTAMTYQGLVAISQSLNLNIDETMALAKELADKGFMSIAEATEAVKTALATGFSLEESRKLILSLGDAAAYSRQSHYGWGEAVVTTLQGIKQGNSTLTDAVGVTTNLSQMYDRYATSIGTTAGKLTDAQKVQAAYNGFMSDAAIYAGNADKAMQGYAGTQARFNQTVATTRAELGEAVLPILQELMDELIPIIHSFAEWANENQDVVAGVVSATAVVGGLILVVTTLTSVVMTLRNAMIALNMSMGPIGWAAIALATVTIGATAYKAAAEATTETIWKFAESQEELNKKLNESPLSRSADDVKKLKSDMEMLNQLLKERERLQERFDIVDAQLTKARSEGESSGIISTLNKETTELRERLVTIDGQLAKLGANTPEDGPKVLAEMNRQLQASVPALIELEQETLRGVRAQYEHIDKVDKLRKRYDELSKVQKLDAAQKTELASVVKGLTQEYPKVDSVLDENGRWIVWNTELIDDMIRAEKEAANAAGEKSKERLEVWRKETEEKLKLAQSQVKALAAAEGVEIENTTLGRLLPKSWGEKLDNWVDDKLEGKRLEAQKRANDLQLLINDIDKELLNITSGSLSKFDSSTSTTDTKKGKTLAELQQEQYQAALKLNEYKKNLGQMNEKQELASLESLLKKYKNNADIRMDLEVKIYKLKEQMNLATTKKSEEAIAASYKASSEWIEKEIDLMTLAGKSDQEINQMKLDAWTRVRNRHEKNTKYYIEADNQLRKVQIENMKLVEKAEQEAAKERDKLLKDVLKKTTDALAKSKKAELDALDELRRAREAYYEQEEQKIDDRERLQERNAIVAQMEKFQHATSERGQKTYNELKERLRQMDVEDAKRKLQQERDDEMEKLDQRKRNIESWYDDLMELLTDYSGDAIGVYKLIEDERFKAFTLTNDKIKTELASLAASYSAIMTGAPTSTGSSNTSVIAQMQANSAAWQSASASKRKELEAANQQLGASIGATYNSGTGKWSLNGKPLYHTGRDGVSGLNYRSGEYLMPGEIDAVLRANEYVFTPEQVSDLVNASSGGGRQVVNNFNAPLIEHSGDVVLQDEADISSYHSEQRDIARQLLARGERADG